MKAQSVFGLIGHTPLIRLARTEERLGLKARLYAKAECFNLTGSVKDRAAYAMIADAEKKGILKAGCTVVEPTSGNFGVSLAAVCAVKGYRVIAVMPDTMSPERQAFMRAYGAKIVLTDGRSGMKGAAEKAEEIAKGGAVLLGQFTHPANPRAHYETTGPEIWEQTAGAADVFVAGVGTGGTLTGAGRFLKERKPTLQAIAVEPFSSPVLSKGEAGAHKIQGIGAGFVPANLDRSVYDAVVAVTDEEAYEGARTLARTEGLFVGISSGAAFAAAAGLCGLAEYEGKTVVALLPDAGSRYLSSPAFGS